MSAHLGAGTLVSSTDSIPLGGTAHEYMPDPDGMHVVRWLERPHSLVQTNNTNAFNGCGYFIAIGSSTTSSIQSFIF